MTVEPQIVNPDPAYPKAELIAPTTLGYVYVAAAVRPGRLPFVLPNRQRSALLKQVKKLAHAVEQLDEVVKVSVFRAIVMPPTARTSSYVKEHKTAVHVANYDVLVLVQTTSPDSALGVRTAPAFQGLVEAMRSQSRSLCIMAARNGKRIGDVDTTRQGLFLFNHFAAEDPDVMLQLWDYLAGWYEVETGLDNSVGLVPLERESADYAIVNWARWDENPLLHFWHQLSNKSFWRYVTPNLEANHAVAMPIYCRLA
jgi:hypothetical protein